MARKSSQPLAKTLLNPYLPRKTKVLEFFRHSPDNFSLKLDARLSTRPGQFVQIYVPGQGECPISIASYENEPLELNIREVGNLTHALAQLREGDSVFVRGPYGKGYPMDALQGNSLVLVGGGCGVAPLKGIIEYIGRHRSAYKDVLLYFGFRSPDDILFKKEQLVWKEQYGLVVTVDQAAPAACYEGNVGFVTDMLAGDARLDGKGQVVLLCGPPRMMEASVNILKKRGFHDDQFFLSTERLMYCAVGKCCHCMIRGKFTCMDGPVFRYDEIRDYKND